MSADPKETSLWHTLDAARCLDALGVEWRRGLTEKEASSRLARHGPNALAGMPKKRLVSLILEQFQDVMVLVLLGATAISFALGEHGDALTIVVIVIVNAILGTIQEARAEKSLEALRELAAPTALVRRDGLERRIPTRSVTIGDILILEPGDRVAADARLLESSGLLVDESALTGEAVPVAKDARRVDPGGAPVTERHTMVFSGTSITSGRAEAVITAVGMGTEVGGIATLVQSEAEGESPLQRRLAGLGKTLVLGCVVLTAVVVLTGMLRGEGPYEMFLIGVSLAVAAIPEGLPAMVTIALAVGVQRMICRRAVVRRLPAVETLGSATVICSDKTGTITANAMTLTRLLLADGTEVAVTGEGYGPAGRVEAGGRLEEARTLLGAAVRASHGSVARLPRTRRYVPQGDPMEAAIFVGAVKAGLDPATLRSLPTVEEIPFDARRRLMTVVVRDGPQHFRAYEKGALEQVLTSAARLGTRGVERRLQRVDRQRIESAVTRLSAGAMRCIAVATAEGKTPEEALRAPRTFLGVVAMADPPRPEVAPAIETCRRAGVRVIMITGDHPATAAAIASEVGLLRGEGGVVTGAEIDEMDDLLATQRLRPVSVCARVAPSTKLRIVRLLRRDGEIVAMTGDGVNDGPAVREADIGVAMGLGGAEVTKEASALVLADDNFGTIVAAVEEGRGIYDNIRKFVRYLLACNVGEILVMFLAALFATPLPLTPIQILWVNLVTDGLPAMALGVDPIDPKLMERPPRDPNEGFFAGRLGVKILSRGILIGASTLGIFLLVLAQGEPLEKARTMAFATLVFSQLFHVFDCRAQTRRIFSNPFLIGAVASSVALLLAAIYVPGMRQTFETVPPTALGWLEIIAVSGLGSMSIGVRRLILRLGLRRAETGVG